MLSHIVADVGVASLPLRFVVVALNICRRMAAEPDRYPPSAIWILADVLAYDLPCFISGHVVLRWFCDPSRETPIYWRFPCGAGCPSIFGGASLKKMQEPGNSSDMLEATIKAPGRAQRNVHRPPPLRCSRSLRGSILGLLRLFFRKASSVGWTATRAIRAPLRLPRASLPAYRRNGSDVLHVTCS